MPPGSHCRSFSAAAPSQAQQGCCWAATFSPKTDSMLESLGSQSRGCHTWSSQTFTLTSPPRLINSLLNNNGDFVGDFSGLHVRAGKASVVRRLAHPSAGWDSRSRHQ